MTDPTPPQQPPLGSHAGSVPPPPPPAEPSRPGSTSSTGSGRRGTGYPPPAVGLVRSTSAGSVQARGGTPEIVGVGRSSSSGALRRNPSRDHLEPLPGGSPSLPSAAPWEATPRRSGSLPRLEPLQPSKVSPSAAAVGSATGSEARPGSGNRSAEVGRGSVPSLSGRLTSLRSQEARADVRHADRGKEAEGRTPVSPPPPPIAVAGATRPPAASHTNDVATPKGPVRWVPHKHENPKHAQFCIICLHGRLEGQKDGGDELRRQRVDEEDLPSAVDMRELGYLLPSSSQFRRVGTDFEKENLSSIWLRDIANKVYDQSVKCMVAEQNSDIILGLDPKLVNDEEEMQDRALLKRFFTFSDEENACIDRKLERLGEWCTAQEDRLLDVMPEPRQRGNLPEVDPPSEAQLKLLEYQPLLELSHLKGETAAEAREALRIADAAIGAPRSSKGYAGFKAADLPPPQTFPDMLDVEDLISPYPLTLDDIPAYEPLKPQPPARQPMDAIIDPFPHPFLHLPEFTENLMPEFKQTGTAAKTKTFPPQAAPEAWLSETESIFPDNNFEEERASYGWGLVPSRDVVTPPFIDEPYLPPFDLMDGPGGSKRLMMRGIWDPELFTQESRMVPPLKARAAALYSPPPFKHPDDPGWSLGLAPSKDPQVKVRAMVPLVPVVSFTRFRPKSLSVQVPDFLWALARDDAAGQGVWDVIVQRHEVPRALKLEQQEAEQKSEDIKQEDEEAMRRSDAFEQSAITIQQSITEDRPEGESNTADPKGLTTGRVTFQEEHVVSERTDGLPTMKLDAPEPPDALTEEKMFTQSAQDITPKGPLTQHPGLRVDRSQALEAHKQRVLQLESSGGEARKAEEIVNDDRFLDQLAERISLRLGAVPGMPLGSTQLPPGMQSRPTTGASTGRLIRPDPPSFAEPEDERDRAQIPRALQGSSAAQASRNLGKGQSTTGAATISDVNVFTQEKMRGDCYVRLLICPEANAARKDPEPYHGSSLDPDITLVTATGRPNLKLPPKRYLSQSGVEEEDEFAEFEKDHVIVFSFVRHNRYDAVEAAIQQDTDILSQAKDTNGNNLLHIACQNNNKRIAKLLLRHGISVNAQNDRGNTPMHYCYQYGFEQLAKFLAAHGADSTIPNNAGWKPNEGLGSGDNAVSAAQRTLRTDKFAG